MKVFLKETLQKEEELQELVEDHLQENTDPGSMETLALLSRTQAALTQGTGI